MTIKNILISFLIPIIWGGLLYLAGSFGNASLDISLWERDSRHLVSVIWVAGIIAILLLRLRPGDTKLLPINLSNGHKINKNR